MSLECGYAAASLGERIYCAPATDPTPMAAILILTGSSGSEGTLGGLIEQGRRIDHHLRRAFQMSALCSNDPVCASHRPGEDDHTERGGAKPELYYDPRTADPFSYASLHAKCLIVDCERSLITSANFTDRGQSRNIEVGVLIHDKGDAEGLERQWGNLIESGDVVPA